MTIPKTRLKDKTARVEVWKNLIILKAETPEQAFLRARKLGKAEAGDCRGSLRLYGKPAITKFIGIHDMGVIHDEPADGMEILWQLRRSSQRVARASSKSKRELLSTLERECYRSSKDLSRQVKAPKEPPSARRQRI